MRKLVCLPLFLVACDLQQTFNQADDLSPPFVAADDLAQPVSDLAHPASDLADGCGMPTCSFGFVACDCSASFGGDRKQQLFVGCDLSVQLSRLLLPAVRRDRARRRGTGFTSGAGPCYRLSRELRKS